MERMFPVLWPWQRDRVRALEAMEAPREVPWALVERHERQALRNHTQTVQRLAERGGLSLQELVDVLSGSSWATSADMPDAVASRTIKKRVEEHRAAGAGGEDG
jgi:hypothetical protein